MNNLDMTRDETPSQKKIELPKKNQEPQFFVNKIHNG